MARFYDPKNDRELSRVEAILRHGGIEYFLRSETVRGLGSMQVHVAEEDIPQAEKLLRKEELKKEQAR
jgi:Putative prokaryotic signal transducing protein